MAQKSGRRRTSRSSEDDAVDSFDVPAAVLCAFCGEAECAGCGAASDTQSGVVAIIPWERTNAGLWTRLWSTANAVTQGADSFFAVMPDGEIPAAMRFAVLAEVLAVASMVAVLLPIAALALPTLALEVVHDPDLRMAALRWVAIGVPALSLWMVLAHVTHGAALDVGARRQGASSQRRRAVRFGLYACGWDLMTGPLGALVTLFSKGFGAMIDLVELAMHVPGRATTALLQGAYKLTPDALGRARRVGSIAAAAIAITSGAALMAVALVLIFA
ncbi:MAG: hypothetical protein ABJE95_10455 [Byssovorax sp.]